MYIHHVALVVELQRHLHLPLHLEVVGLLVIYLPLHFLDLTAVQSAVDCLPELGITNVRIYISLLAFLILYSTHSTISLSIRYSLLILLYWKCGVTS